MENTEIRITHNKPDPAEVEFIIIYDGLKMSVKYSLSGLTDLLSDVKHFVIYYGLDFIISDYDYENSLTINKPIGGD